ncbi:gluconate 2-dehydrogenase subunit 3 family protein [Pseudoxanthomonas winnipegensis]|uniref:Gluconate 2-dehydrogenase subunit 3 family protein n=1 Tax=Pseudoxanthomonas winnipegensis TaxID=2480810 RepID=A0A4Q8LCP5_9GAMM|nr:gluconate 2-dehydrogenase subunit 3 family protein [Pseudoxanthomonas winnipegensis]RZZ83645.1 gluconate 2-dehydrogenase subunit 3 family protein [Pseudoxanthomonas winnipegensis]TAA26310.1 gluconate 2-dehydrogenase subunit 3 family protein [Pseudoxanthomonas winnipegensis]TAA42771.1 gluconate 2-dehydrogenase subunit 3 family protein [Pseudoxanthomonas winnipegensis]TBV73131.1 gluconate 2-dehydrogenase subunit 3 family protein [Pseudoxanthomonas winnipegensis]
MSKPPQTPQADAPTATTRRAFLRLSLAVAPAAVALGACDGQQGEAGRREGASAADPAPYQPTYFSAAEWACLQAVVARLIPGDAHDPGALEAGVPEYIDRQMGTPWAAGRLWFMQGPFQPDAPATLGYQLRLAPRELYRLGLADLDQACRAAHGKAFAELDAAAQDGVLQQLEAGALALAQVPPKALFGLLLANAREGFFCDPRHGGNRDLVGWKLIGFPGARADFMDWVERDVAYPLPPVSIDGVRG